MSELACRVDGEHGDCIFQWQFAAQSSFSHSKSSYILAGMSWSGFPALLSTPSQTCVPSRDGSSRNRTDGRQRGPRGLGSGRWVAHQAAPPSKDSIVNEGAAVSVHGP